MRKYICDLCLKEISQKELRNCDWFLFGAQEEICYNCAKVIWKEGKKILKQSKKESVK